MNWKILNQRTWLNLISAVIPVVGLSGAAYQVVPRKPRDPEKMQLWHRKFGTMIKVLSPFLIGLLELFGVL